MSQPCFNKYLLKLWEPMRNWYKKNSQPTLTCRTSLFSHQSGWTVLTLRSGWSPSRVCLEKKVFLKQHIIFSRTLLTFFFHFALCQSGWQNHRSLASCISENSVLENSSLSFLTSNLSFLSLSTLLPKSTIWVKCGYIFVLSIYLCNYN